jgi:hypothetical protein
MAAVVYPHIEVTQGVPSITGTQTKVMKWS